MTEKQQLDAELTEVLKHLAGWQLDSKYADHCWCAVLIDNIGRGIHVNAMQAKGRLYLSGMWPTDSDRQQHRPDKSFSRLRTSKGHGRRCRALPIRTPPRPRARRHSSAPPVSQPGRTGHPTRAFHAVLGSLASPGRGMPS